MRFALFDGIDHLLVVRIPETTSAEAYESHIRGKCLRACRGAAWRDIKACIIESPRIVDLGASSRSQRTIHYMDHVG